MKEVEIDESGSSHALPEIYEVIGNVIALSSQNNFWQLEDF